MLVHLYGAGGLGVEFGRGDGDGDVAGLFLRLDEEESLASEGGGSERTEGTEVIGMACSCDGDVTRAGGLDVKRNLSCGT